MGIYVVQQHSLYLFLTFMNTTRLFSSFVYIARRSWPVHGMSKDAEENTKIFFVLVAKFLRTIVKMSRVGVLARIGVSLSVSYVDLVSDVLVFIDYYRKGRKQLAYASGGCITFSLFAQAVLAFQQYRFKSIGEVSIRTVAAFCSLSPLLEGINSWTGRVDPKLPLAASSMYALTKGIEIAFESIPGSLIQINLFLLKRKVLEAKQTFIFLKQAHLQENQH